MSQILKKIIEQAQDESWRRMRGYKTVLEAVTFNPSQVMRETLAELLIKECINICLKNGHEASAEEIKSLLPNQSKSVDK